MVHSPRLTNQLGRLVANDKCLPVHIILEKYEEYLEEMLKMEPTPKSHANVLQKISGFFGNDLLAEQKLRMRDAISNYRLGLVDLESTLLILEVITRKFQKTYLVRQTYFLLYCRVMLEDD
ncbi:MAG: YbgA family protein [Candidatus Nitrosotenuis sp.]